MKIHVYSIVWNEEFLLPYFLRHYSTFADRIFIINDHSSDKTVEIARAHPKVQLLDFGYSRGLNEDDFSRCFEESYKKYSRGVADWVMCVDADEFIYNKDMRGALQKAQQQSRRTLKTTGYTMMSETLPTTDGQIYEQCPYGLRARGYDKEVVFNPELDIKFSDGRHSITVSNDLRPVKAKLALLHYRYLSRDYLIERTKNIFARMDMSDEIKSYRLKRGLATYDKNINNLEKVV